MVIQAGLCWTLHVLQVSDHLSSKESYSGWREAFPLSCLGSFLSLCREVSYLASFSTVLFIFTDLWLKSNNKHPNNHVNIQYFWQLRDKPRCSAEHFWKKIYPGHLKHGYSQISSCFWRISCAFLASFWLCWVLNISLSPRHAVRGRQVSLYSHLLRKQSPHLSKTPWQRAC